MAVTINGTTGITTPDLDSSADITANGVPFGKGGGSVSNNIAIGTSALAANTSGTSNFAAGVNALDSVTTGTDNVAIGNSAGQAVVTANGNVFIGVNAGAFTTGGENTFIGSGVTGVDGGAGFYVTTGTKNTILGKFDGNQGGLDIRTSNNNIVLSDGDGNPRIHVSSGGQVYFLGLNLALGGVTPSIYRTGSSTYSGFHFTAPGAYPTDGNGALNDNVMPLGTGIYRFSVIYAGTGTINTSDQNEKQDIAPLSEAELRVAKSIKGLIKKYRWKDAVETKGEGARIHVGVIAQEVKAAFEAEGLDAHRYGMFCSNTAYKVNGQAMDAEGNWHTADTEGAVEFTRLGVRYDELLAFVIAAL